MTGAMYAAVAGLRAHMTALNVISNNVSNVNTAGYKSARYTFNEAIYTTYRTGSDGTTTLGGRNPAQIGFGCSIGTIDLDMSSKNYNPTGYAMDCTIDGDGFFIVGDKTRLGITTQEQLQGMNLTRLGNFDVKDGYLVDGEGSVVYGFLTVQDEDGETSISEILTPIRIPYGQQEAETVTDAFGEDTTIITNTPLWPTVSESGNVVDSVPDGTDADNPAERISLNTFAIDETGRITITTSDAETYVVGYIAIAKVDSPNGVTHVDGRYYQAQGGAGNVHLSTVGGAVVFDPSDGDNDSPQELTIESAGSTAIITGGLESSGTDLANEITNMICIQRGYQANTRIVTVTDSMLEELVNMKR